MCCALPCGVACDAIRPLHDPMVLCTLHDPMVLCTLQYANRRYKNVTTPEQAQELVKQGGLACLEALTLLPLAPEVRAVLLLMCCDARLTYTWCCGGAVACLVLRCWVAGLLGCWAAWFAAGHARS